MGQQFCTQCHKSPEKDIELGDVSYNHKEFADRGVPCQNCHLEAVQGDGKVDKNACNSCHSVPEHLSKFNDGEYMHLTHVTNHKVDCHRCHGEIKHAVKTTLKPLDYSCNVCHSATHDATKDLYMGKGGKGVADKPSHMFQVQVDCIGCHVTREFSQSVARFRGQTFRPSEAGCKKCHGEDVNGMMAEWEKTVAEELAKTKGLLDKAEAQLKTGMRSAKFSRELEEARYNYEFVKYAKGIHNVEYALDLLNHSNKISNGILEKK